MIDVDFDFDFLDDDEPALQQSKTLTFKEFYELKIPLIVGKNTIDRGWYGDLVLETLQEFYNDFAAGKCPRLIIQTPPQHMKSTTITAFLAYMLSREEGINAIYTSYADSLVRTANRRIRMGLIPDMVGFPANFHEVNFLNGSRLVTRPINSSLTGTPSDLNIIDDPYKGLMEARSNTIREGVEEVWNTVLNARLSAKGAWLMTLTRWHKEDLAGHILAKEKEIMLNATRIEADAHISPIKILSYPAIAKSDEYHPKTNKPLRKAGEALMPKFKPKSFLEDLKARMPIFQWEAVYQQNPIAEGTQMIDISKISIIKPELQLLNVYVVVDTAYKDKSHNDFTSFVCVGEFYQHNQKRLVILDNYRLRVESDVIYQPLEAFVCRQISSSWWSLLYAHPAYPDSPHKSLSVWIEDKSSGITILQSYKKNPLKIGDKYVAVRPIDTGYFTNSSKQDRTLLTLEFMKMGYVSIADFNRNYQELLDELSDFTINNTHSQDGYVDVVNYAIIITMGLKKRK